MTTPQQVEVEAVTPDQWERLRDIRLAALRDAPNAFWSTSEEERDRPAEAWRDRIEQDRSSVLIATVRSPRGGRRDVGLAIIGPHHDDEQDVAGLYAVWVDPAARGRGVGDALVTSALEHARSLAYARVVLDVGDHNHAAIALYERLGFERTGRTSAFPPPRDSITEHERAVELP